MIRFWSLNPLKKELIKSMYGHGGLLIAILLFSLFQPHMPFRHEKYFTVNLRSLGGSPGPLTAPGPKSSVLNSPTAPTITKTAPITPPTKPQTQKVLTPAAPTKPPTKPVVQQPTPPKVQTLKPQAKTLTKPVPKTESKTPSLSERLKKRLEEVKSPEVASRFKEPSSVMKNSSLTAGKIDASAKNYHFVEPEAWSEAQRTRGGSQTQISAGGGGGSGGKGVGGGGSPDGKEFPYSWYLDLIQNKITMNWKEPAKSLAPNNDLSAIVSFEITSKGQVEKIKWAERSGFSALDDSVLEAVEASIPLPPLPENYPDRKLGVKIKFELTQ
ncbi:MAG: TonB family protein [Chlamydiae bacterium]|nr:TonB family protein [Chlamydiota bacterium]MBI3265950.1 TonB family protein [Chlamydiota bacterium]